MMDGPSCTMTRSTKSRKERLTRDANLIDITQRRNFFFDGASPVATPPYDHT